ncbi:mechanosensitive ion channel family protein [Laedolimicola ammoniilytica]|uniref:Mechanosensitive ion channel n=1 Tax=Laedolimicola ammoniilytica TaxID=2981771 RepID=A0ABT2RUR3_9FIRM|nr:mechanosensitive ion channel domain-containing protein [Laedolimicola ammoniilytica]MCU6696053.1 mechanosensitive ion channel [Laedolimicola ammoniilytica]SCH42739.1 Small-conductance mechanosensitive channel [uncultured Clostridium sp.]SCH89887.1 Small-conductance mechanosensitive channel [uncultured Clostridium sp.]
MRCLATVADSPELAAQINENIENVTQQISRTQEYIDKYLPVVISFGLRLLLTIILFIVGGRLIKVVRKIVRRSMERTGADVGVIQFMDSLIKLILYFLLVLFLADGIGVDTTSVMALVGSAGLTIGLAFQGSLSNFAGGVLILLIKPFKVGDYIIYTSGNLEGKVTKIEMFYTTLFTVDNKKVVIPNGTLSNSSLINVTAEDKRRIDITVGVSYTANLKLAKEVCLNLLTAQPAVLQDQNNLVVVDDLADSSVNLKICCWVTPDDYWSTRWDLIEKIKLAFDENGIEIPFNQLDVNLKQ